MSILTLKQALLLSAAGGMSFAVPVSAQSADGQRADNRGTPVAVSAPEQQDATPSSGDSADIVVTGSRVASNGFSAPSPVTVLDAARLQAQAPSSITETLVRLPAFRDVGSSEQQGRFAGSNTAGLDLRGLGAVRTLVLVDGRRFVPTTPAGTVDSYLLPQIMVQRVEVVTGGASSAYGSDAVAGVVNFILKDRFEGVTGRAQYGISGQGDVEERVGGLSAGASLMDDRLHIVAGGDFSFTGGAGTIYDRDWSRDEEWLISYPNSRPAGTPARAFRRNVTYSQMTAGSVITTGPLAGTAFGPGGTPYRFNSGEVIGNVMIGGSNPGLNPAGNYRLVQPVDRYSVLGRATFDIDADTSAFVEGSYGNQKSSGMVTWQQTPSLVVNITNPFIPDATRAEMTRLGLSSITVGRVGRDLGGGRFHIEEYDTARAVAGIKGRVFDAIDWDAYYQHGRSTVQANYPTDVLPANLAAAAYVVAGANGQPTCGPIATNPNLTAATRPLVTPGCVPFNVFGENSRSAEAFGYVTDDSYNLSVVTQDVVALNLRAKPFSTWAGPVSIAAGIEGRRESVGVTANPLNEVGAHSLNNDRAYAGTATVREAYGEILVPLASNASWADSLDLNAAGRVTDYSTSGTVTTWKVGANYATPFGLRLRGTRSRDIRAPSLANLFSASSFGALLNGARNPFTGTSGTLSGFTGGNPNLVPERADTLTVGAVFQPKFAPGLGLSVDWYDVHIEDVIVTPTATEAITRCQAGEQPYCNLFVRDQSAFGAYVVLSPANLATRDVRGMDFEASYSRQLSDIVGGAPGAISIKLLATYAKNNKTTNAGVTIDRAGSGIGGAPTWTYNFDLTYTAGRFFSNINVRGFNRFKFDSTAVGPEDEGYDPTLSTSVSQNRFPGAAYLNIGLGYDVSRADGRRVQLFFNVNNLLDHDPAEFALVAFTSGGNPYGVIGRYFRGGVRFEL